MPCLVKDRNRSTMSPEFKTVFKVSFPYKITQTTVHVLQTTFSALLADVLSSVPWWLLLILSVQYYKKLYFAAHSISESYLVLFLIPFHSQQNLPVALQSYCRCPFNSVESSSYIFTHIIFTFNLTYTLTATNKLLLVQSNSHRVPQWNTASSNTIQQ